MILLVASLASIDTQGIAKEAETKQKAPPRKVKAVNADSQSSPKRAKTSKLSNSLLASATKPRETKNTKLTEELASLSETDSQATKPNLSSVKDLAELGSESRREGKLTIGATARVQEAQSELLFQARVDTGAASCSVHCEKWKIDDESDSMEENIGKDIRVLISNEEQESRWVDSRIDQCVVVKTSEDREMRYKVPMTFRWNDFEKEVVVTLNNRGHMNFPLLLGRNFLEGDFVVDIEMGD